MLYTFVMVGVSNTYLNWHGHTGGKFTCFLAYALTFWPAHLLSGLRTYFLAFAIAFWLTTGLRTYFLASAIAFWLTYWPVQLCLGLRNCVFACATVQFYGVCLKCGVCAQPHQTALCDNNTQQPTFLMEFLDGNDCSGVALIGPVIYLSFSPFGPLLL
jgi:hypothetical protein